LTVYDLVVVVVLLLIVDEQLYFTVLFLVDIEEDLLNTFLGLEPEKQKINIYMSFINNQTNVSLEFNTITIRHAL